jgi:xanthine dehydrogenase accessory factor
MRVSPRTVVWGGGELGSASARLLCLAGFPVIVIERPQPLAVRRRVCFAEAVWSGSATVEGLPGRLVEPAAAATETAAPKTVLVVIDSAGDSLPLLRPDVLVDARMTKRSPPTFRPGPAVAIGLGPGFTAGADVDAVIETQRGPDLGRVLWSGSARPDTGRPSPVLGVADERVLRSPRSGVFHAASRIGDLVTRGARVGEVDGESVVAATAGLLRGLIHDGVEVEAGTKLGDVDPRGAGVDTARISDKARAVAAGVLEAALIGWDRAAGRSD